MAAVRTQASVQKGAAKGGSERAAQRPSQCQPVGAGLLPLPSRDRVLSPIHPRLCPDPSASTAPSASSQRRRQYLPAANPVTVTRPHPSSRLASQLYLPPPLILPVLFPAVGFHIRWLPLPLLTLRQAPVLALLSWVPVSLHPFPQSDWQLLALISVATCVSPP